MFVTQSDHPEQARVIMANSCCRTGLLWVGFVPRSIKNFDKAALNGTLETLSNRLIIAANRKTRFVRLARTVYGRFWQVPLAADMKMSRQGVIRWAKGKHKISLEKEIHKPLTRPGERRKVF